MANCQSEMKKAVECGYWNMFRFNPALKAEGKNPFTLDSKAPAGGYQEFLMNEARYSSLTRSFPERAKELFAQNEEEAKAPLREAPAHGQDVRGVRVRSLTREK